MIQFFKFLFSKTFLINSFLAVLLIALSLFGVLKYLDYYTLHGKKMKVPDLLDQHYEALEDRLTSENEFSVVVTDSIYKKGVKHGTILEQNPEASTTVKQGRKIYVTIAAAEPPKVSMPNLVDMSLRQARVLMKTFGLEIGELKYRSDLCVNCILAQEMNGKEIEKGEKVPKGSAIDLVVGQGLGDELVSVPFLIGLTHSMAKDLLQSKSLNVGSILIDESIEGEKDSINAIIYKQIPEYEEEPSVRMGSSIDLFLTIDSSKVNYSFKPGDSI